MDMQKMMKEMQKMQSKMSKIQSEMESKIFEGEAGGGMVKISMSGKYDIKAIQLKKEVVDPEDVEALEDLLLAAFHSAKAKVDADSQAAMGSLTGGLKIPGLM